MYLPSIGALLLATQVREPGAVSSRGSEAQRTARLAQRSSPGISRPKEQGQGESRLAILQSLLA